MQVRGMKRADLMSTIATCSLLRDVKAVHMPEMGKLTPRMRKSRLGRPAA